MIYNDVIDKLENLAGAKCYVYRGASGKELDLWLKNKQENQDKFSLIANDYEVLEYGFPEIRDMEEDKIEKYFKNIIPKWAYEHGLNTTSDYNNACGYAESREGYILILDISNSDIWEASDSHIQIKNAEKVKLIAVIDSKNYKIVYINKNEIKEEDLK